MMKVKLVSMPWHHFDGPSFALGSLAAFIRANEPRVSIECRNEHVSVWAKLRKVYETISHIGAASELTYLQQFYPEKAGCASRELLAETEIRQQTDSFKHLHKITKKDWALVLAVTREHLAQTSGSLAEGTDLVGLTTSFSQLFSSLCLARILKEQNPSVRIVFGGVSASVAGASLLAEYPFIDFVVCGEGELRLLHLIRCLLDGKEQISPRTGILARQNMEQADSSPALLRDNTTWEVTNLDELPLPDYDDYYERLRKECHVLPFLPMQCSRGCWWDRKARTGNAFQACYFCGLTNRVVHRDKSIPQVIAQMNLLAARYRNTRFFFIDTLLRRGDRREFAQAIRAFSKSFFFNLEIRADIKASTLVDFKEAGCLNVEIGVEGLSTAYLKRLNKGTSTIQNLYAMRACYELEIVHDGNLVLDFPGATQAEVEEVQFNILNFAIGFTPLTPRLFMVVPDSTVFLQPTHFGVQNIRMAKAFQNSLPRDVASRLQLPWLEFDVEGKRADWRPVLEACQKWSDLHQKIHDEPPVPSIPKTLFYFDGGDFLEIFDARQACRTIMLEGLWRELYLYCMEIRSRQEIIARFQDLATEEHLVPEILESMVTERLIFTENSQYLSLAVASNPTEAIRRIRTEEAQSAQAGGSR